MSENDLGIGVRLGLVFTGEVQVDVRLLIALKAKEGLKGDVKAVLFELLSAFGTHAAGQVDPAFTLVLHDQLRIKIRVVAVGAIIMRGQGIHLRDPRHGRGKGRSYGAAGTDQVTVLDGFPHELLGDDVHDRVAVGDDGPQLSLEPFFDDLRQGIPVHAVRLVIADPAQHLVTVRNNGRALVRTHRGQGVDHVRDAAGIGDDDLFRFFRAQVGKLLQHLICGAQI